MKKVMLLLVIGTAFSGRVYGQTVPTRVQGFLNRNYPDWKIGRSWVADAPFPKAIENVISMAMGKWITRFS